MVFHRRMNFKAVKDNEIKLGGQDNKPVHLVKAHERIQLLDHQDMMVLHYGGVY